MRVEGTREFAVPAQSVWDVLVDPAGIASLMPDVSSFEVQDDHHWTAKVKVRLGIGGLRLKFAFEMYDERPIEYARLKAKGNGVGALVDMDTEFTLAPIAEDRTSMGWVADVRVAGQAGAMGQRVIEPIIRNKVNEVMNALDRKLTGS